MDWLMFVIIVFCDLLTVLICRYAYHIDNQYRNGMILGVHIPAWAVCCEDVQTICAKSVKRWKWYHSVNLILGIGIGLPGFWSTEIMVIMWLVWLTIYIIGCYVLIVLIYREMYHLKTKNNWYDERTKKLRVRTDKEGRKITEYIDEDVYWLSGCYSNPTDKRMLVENKFCNANMEFNMAKPAAKAIVFGLLSVTVIVIVWCIYLFIPLVHLDISLERTGEQIQIEGGGYDIEFDISEVEHVELLTSMPEERFSRKNGGSSNEYRIGHFKGSESGKTMLFLFNEYTPILKIELEDETVYLNSKEPGETEAWYEIITKQD